MRLPEGFKFFLVSPGNSLEYTLISPEHALILPPQCGAVMLALLANYSRPVSRETMLATMYPDKRPPNAQNVLSICVKRIRDMLGDYGITFDLHSDQIRRPDLGPSVTLTNLRQQPQEKPRQRPQAKDRGKPQAEPRKPPSAPKRGSIRPVNDDAPWTFPARVEARNRRSSP